MDIEVGDYIYWETETYIDSQQTDIERVFDRVTYVAHWVDPEDDPEWFYDVASSQARVDRRDILFRVRVCAPIISNG